MRVVVVTFARLITSPAVKSDRHLKIVLAIEVYPAQGGTSGVVFHGVQQGLGNALPSKLGANIEAFTFRGTAESFQRSQYYATCRCVTDVGNPQS